MLHVWLGEGVPAMCINPQRIAVVHSRRLATVRKRSLDKIIGNSTASSHALLAIRLS